MTRFCILTTQRSGSTWLCHLLNNHPRVKECGELFIFDHNGVMRESRLVPFWKYREQHPGKGKLQLVWSYLSQLDRFADSYDALGFKLMYNHVNSYPQILLKLIIDRYRIIHLVRANYLDTFISKALAKQRGVFHFHSQAEYLSDESEQVVLSTNKLLRKLEAHDRGITRARRYLTFLPLRSLTVSYESLYNDKVKTLQSILEFLSVPDAAATSDLDSDMKKLNKKLAAEVIVNYEEVKAMLANTRFAEFLQPNE